jgi:hypothetical protein
MVSGPFLACQPTQRTQLFIYLDMITYAKDAIFYIYSYIVKKVTLVHYFEEICIKRELKL